MNEGNMGSNMGRLIERLEKEIFEIQNQINAMYIELDKMIEEKVEQTLIDKKRQEINSLENICNKKRNELEKIENI